MKPASAFARWRTHQLELLSELPRALQAVEESGTPEAVHHLRVSVRRLRQYLRVGVDVLGRNAVRDFRDWSREVSEATDGLRDLDVTLEWLEPRSESEAVARRLKSQRLRKLRDAQAKLPKLSGKLRARLGRCASDRKAHERLQRRLRDCLARLAERFTQDGPGFFRADELEQHDFRRALRRWRYLRELVLPKRKRGKDELYTRVSALQGTLGDRQNLILVEAALRRQRRNPVAQQLAVRARSEHQRLLPRLRAELRRLTAQA